ncbi:MAG: hypothetical protein J6J26_11285 [Bacteroides sp.]|nr:hypothetical protein [Bacteroidaceae bacterium]MBP3670123.1 hypothetical protein [Bacteroides sp.]
MKKTLLYLATALFAFLFSACNDNDTEGVIYNAANTEAVFTTAKGSYFYNAADPGEYTVTLMRGNANGTASVSISSTNESGYFNVPATANFADGEYETTFTVTFDKEALEIGKNYNIAMKLPETPITGKQISYTLTVTRDYTWEFYANCQAMSDLFGEWENSLERAKENPSYFKLKDAYAEGYDIKFLVDENGSISMPEGPGSNGYYDVTTGYMHPSYGMMYSYLDGDPAYSYFDIENHVLVLSQYFYVGAGGFGWYDDVFTW